MCRYLSEEEAIRGLQGVQRAYGQVAWRFLDACGFINFGVMQQVPEQGTSNEAVVSRNIIIIGAGMAGNYPHRTAAKQVLYPEP